MGRAAIGALVVLAACAANTERAPDRCEMRTATQALTAAERAVVGEASPYPGDAMLRARTDELVRSQRARRTVAWQALARALAPVELAPDVAAHAGPDRVPRWRTWYGKDDLKRVFQHVFRPLPAELRHARGPLPDADLDAAFVWNPSAVATLPDWPPDRWQAYLASLTDQLALDGTGGTARVGYSPSAARELLASYAQEMHCLADGAPPAFVDGAPGQPTVAREALALAGCEDRTFGPYFVASGETITAHAQAAVAIRRDAPDGAIACATAPGEPCRATGPGAMWVIASADAAPVVGTLVVETIAPAAPWAGCLADRFAFDAALVKADWRRVGFGFTVPVHATTADALARRLAGDADWADGEGSADPGPDEIYTVRDAYGDTYRLSALHLMTRELDHWLWITIWWSPDPDGDFGADRPVEIGALPGPWSHYKMCTTVAFTERDPDPSGGYAADHPDLAAALAATTHPGGPSWCSNPYLELGHGDATTNCIGCHQHGGTGLTTAAILAQPTAFPASGRTQLRDNFPADYSWQTDNGDMLGAMLRDEVEYWDSVP